MLDELLADLDKHHPQVGVDALVDVEMVVGRQGRHNGGDTFINEGGQHLTVGTVNIAHKAEINHACFVCSLFLDAYGRTFVGTNHIHVSTC